MPSIRIPDMGPSQLGLIIQRVKETVATVRYRRLKDELLQAVNPEINTDREVLVSRLEQFGFRREIVEGLTDVDRRIMAAGTALDFKACVDLLRTIFEEIIEDGAKKAAHVKRVTLPTGQLGPFQPWKDLLVRTDVLTREEGEVFQKMYNYLSVVGTHTLGSHVEHARVAKNVVIELSLLVVGRVQAVCLPTSR